MLAGSSPEGCAAPEDCATVLPTGRSRVATRDNDKAMLRLKGGNGYECD